MDWLRDKEGNFIPTTALQMLLFFPAFALGFVIGAIWSGIECGIAAGKEPPK